MACNSLKFNLKEQNAGTMCSKDFFNVRNISFKWEDGSAKRSTHPVEIMFWERQCAEKEQNAIIPKSITIFATSKVVFL